MEKNNKKRLLYLLEILRKKTDGDRHMPLSTMISELEARGIEVANRKTIYDDIRTLNECGYDIEYDDGYYLLEAPFSLSEIKIILDSVNSLKNLDAKLLDDLNGKLFSFISSDEEKLLNRLSYTSRHKNRKLLQRMEDILEAIKNGTGVTIKKKNGEKELVFPLFLHRSNDYYYFYCHYENSDKLYHYRFDNIINLTLSGIKDTMTIPRDRILSTIEASSNSFYKGGKETVLIKVLEPSEYLDERFLDDFPNAIKTKDGYSIIVSVNDSFFSRLLAYGTDIKISDPKTAHEYQKFLKKVMDLYLPEK
ncbi:MAG: WYL domain-containing protein [Erysipelotrichaceae bacterium]|nr:WYL domain-containing protein [Erysipelotrichaceae bacterium]